MTETATRPVESQTWPPEPMSERVVVRCYGSYDEAKRAVDQLTVGARIPGRSITVFGRGLSWRPGFSATRFIKASALGGAALAAAAALILWSLGALDAGFTWFAALVSGALLGGALGLVLGIAGWAFTNRDGSIPETGHVGVDQYDLLVEIGHAEPAQRFLDGHGEATSAA